MNHSMAENFMRSAKAPAISAGVMIAKVIWKQMNTVSGMVLARSCTPSERQAAQEDAAQAADDGAARR